MLISIATANFYFLPFWQTLEMIAETGINNIELDLYWEGGTFSIAQHLKGFEAREVVKMVNQYGLKVSSIHDGGGVIEDSASIQGFINPELKEYLDQLGYAPGCIVFHTPHIEGVRNEFWWHTISNDVKNAIEEYMSKETSVTIENMPFFDGYYVPITSPQELLEFVFNNEIGVTLDTTHYAQIGIDIIAAARILRNKIKTIHLSDLNKGKSHVFIGDGTLDLMGLFQVIDLPVIHSITLECSMGRFGEDIFKLKKTEIVERLRLAISRLQSWIKKA